MVDNDYLPWIDVDDLSVDQIAYLWAEGVSGIGVAMRRQILQTAIATGKLRVDGTTGLIWRGDLKEFAKARGERPFFLFGPPPVANPPPPPPPGKVYAKDMLAKYPDSQLLKERIWRAEQETKRLQEAIERADAREAARRAEMRTAEALPASDNKMAEQDDVQRTPALADEAAELTAEETTRMYLWLVGDIERRRGIVGEKYDRDTMVLALRSEFSGMINSADAEALYQSIPEKIRFAPMGRPSGSSERRKSGRKYRKSGRK